MTLGDGYSDAGIEPGQCYMSFCQRSFSAGSRVFVLVGFHVPPMRHVISFDWDSLNGAVNDRQTTRTIIPDGETLVDQYVSAAMQIDGIELSFDSGLHDLRLPLQRLR